MIKQEVEQDTSPSAEVSSISPASGHEYEKSIEDESTVDTPFHLERETNVEPDLVISDQMKDLEDDFMADVGKAEIKGTVNDQVSTTQQNERIQIKDNGSLGPEKFQIMCDAKNKDDFDIEHRSSDQISDVDQMKEIPHLTTQAGNEIKETMPVEKVPQLPEINVIQQFIKRVGLGNFFPNKLELMDAMKINSTSDNVELSDVALLFVKNLVMMNFTCRDQMVFECLQKIEKKHIPKKKKKQDLSSNLLDDLLGDDEDDDGSDNIFVNPIDLILAVFECSSPSLKQILASKLFMCKLAIPFSIPVLSNDTPMLSLWPLRSVIIESSTGKSSQQQTSINCPSHIVSFIRMGRPTVSKSKFVNEILNDQYHHTFFNKDCPLGTTNRIFSNGLVETTWYLPSRKTNILNNVTMILNLRGDGIKYITQLEMIAQLSAVVVVMADIMVLEDEHCVEILQKLYVAEGGVVLAIDGAQNSKKAIKDKLQYSFGKIGQNTMRTKLSILKMDGKERSVSLIKNEIRNGICELVENIPPSTLSVKLRHCHVRKDEDAECYKTAKRYAEDVVKCIPKNSRNIKEQIVPLQGKMWRSFSTKLKQVHKSSQYKTLIDIGKIQMEMRTERNNQAKICANLGLLMRTFLHNLSIILPDKNTCSVFVSWLKLLLDERSRSTLPEYLNKYQTDWQILKRARDKKESESVIAKHRKALEDSEYNLAEASFGLEHLCREMGQIYEALHFFKSKDPKLQALENSLPKICAQLLMDGQPFEIMDGDAANVPDVWVKSVLEELRIILGEKRLLALSVLGIQSSGKSTLLNTMFGLQFAVSAGRCTRGVYMQLVPVEAKQLPFEYVVVIDTEGLRAPELAHQKYSHDNELATFVIGLGDITIINIKGENTAEMKDVLQIAVHAFLRLKLANSNLNLKQSCVFVHQNVPASDANDKMMQGRQKFVEILDAMTKEAADQENMVDINSFNEVISFNSEENVWYFSDLWHGDPPMAPTNRGYSESVVKVKEAIIFKLTKERETYLNIGHTISRIEDLWRGILKDDFVFSFRNSLELKAYISMEQECQSLSWKLEKYVLEFVKFEAKKQLKMCKDPTELENLVPSIVTHLALQITTKVEGICNDLNDFVEKNSLKDVMIQWTENKRNRFRLNGENLVLKAKTSINNIKEEMRIQKLRLSEKTKHEMEINELARKLALEMKGKLPSKSVLENQFNNLWNSWINKFDSKDIRDIVPIKDQIESMLCEKFPSDVTYLTQRSSELDKQDYERLTKLEGSLTVSYIHSKIHLSIFRYLKIGPQKEDPSSCKRQTIDVVDNIFRKIDMKLAELNSQDIRFDISYVTEILMIVTTGIAAHNNHTDNHYNFNLLPPFNALIIDHVVRYLTVFLTRKNDAYNKKNSPKAQMNEYKGTAWALFKNMVDSKTEDVIALSFFKQAVTNLVVEDVAEYLPIATQDKMRNVFAGGKAGLMQDMLKDLAQSERFDRYKSFILDPYTFAEKWVMDCTRKTIFQDKINGLSLYAQFAKRHIENIFSKLYESVSIATKVCTQKSTLHISNWVDAFLEYNIDLPLSIDDLVHVRNRKVKDLQNFECMLKEEFEDMKEKVFKNFKDKTADTVKWKKQPIPDIMDHIWGCTETCMFCKEPCMNTDKNHVKDGFLHKCLQHRPQGIGGFRDSKTEVLTVDFCNFLVSTDTEMYEFVGKGLEGAYIDYKKHFPDWDIPPNSDTSKYWMWMVCQFQDELVEMYDCVKPNIPDNWKTLTKEDAIASL